jgi:hypothetical protein
MALMVLQWMLTWYIGGTIVVKAKPKYLRGELISFPHAQDISHMSFVMIEARASALGFEESYIEFESHVCQFLAYVLLFGMAGLWYHHDLSRVQCICVCLCMCACPSVSSNNFRSRWRIVGCLSLEVSPVVTFLNSQTSLNQQTDGANSWGLRGNIHSYCRSWDEVKQPSC